MGYKRTTHTVYLVHWPEINVFKIGYTEFQRYRAFVVRGANILKLFPFPTSTEAFDLETICHDVLWNLCEGGFDTPQEATPYLGNRGGGYVECFKTPADLMPSEIWPYVEMLIRQKAAA
ncbi:uncharacterized protein RMCC_2459 [Mycolicibacterium canariasense]|uniref:Uncharacterized protein n=1 Tax=Mycolicibacterium canariasense TaxID=228230 RepID=A0A124E227_MYCCR|nr:hypothetical protein [Mycolicibacterium canariasense]MCV7212641.1 hypothetical protein [Mycolicibacterium canariasense]ORV02521.1 hypothetical protein AWB94_00855 [Mycolicibacterium canariasense]GAS95493.1 uncharacterized protein RMCC_2459 [Mycolicibacterium canariasense]